MKEAEEKNDDETDFKLGGCVSNTILFRSPGNFLTLDDTAGKL